jgi:hypothetical protein
MKRVGDFWMPRIRILDPETDLPINARPTVRVVAPNGSVSEPVVHALDDESLCFTRVHLVSAGAWRLIVESPAPRKEVATASTYVGPRL